TMKPLWMKHCATGGLTGRKKNAIMSLIFKNSLPAGRAASGRKEILNISNVWRKKGECGRQGGKKWKRQKPTAGGKGLMIRRRTCKFRRILLRNFRRIKKRWHFLRG